MTFIFVCNTRCTPRLTTIAFGLWTGFSVCENETLLVNPPFSAGSLHMSICDVCSWELLLTLSLFRQAFRQSRVHADRTLIKSKLLGARTYHGGGRGRGQGCVVGVRHRVIAVELEQNSIVGDEAWPAVGNAGLVRHRYK